jgi:hypothetical protein
MRAKPILFALLLLAAPADAGMRAAYDGSSEPRRLEIETADNGDFRIGPPGDAQYVLRAGGTTYLVSTTPEGPEVVRLDDMAAALGEAMPPFFRDLFTAAARAQPAPSPRRRPRSSAAEAAASQASTARSTRSPWEPRRKRANSSSAAIPG